MLMYNRAFSAWSLSFTKAVQHKFPLRSHGTSLGAIYRFGMYRPKKSLQVFE